VSRSPRTAASVPAAAPAGRLRLDEIVVARGLAPSRARAQALILAGRVRVGSGDAARSDLKAGALLPRSTIVEVPAPEPYVSRGGHKLAAALDAFAIDPAGLVCLDVGASTGGFTDVLLQRGALRVYAIDVGRGQLAEVLRADPRVISMERMNARSITPASLPEAVALATIDVSFISLGLVLGPVASAFGPAGGRIVALVKPQFEAGRAAVRDGVVRDPAVHREVLTRVVTRATELGLAPCGLIASPLLGPEGNREFLLDLVVSGPGAGAVAVPVEVVEHIAALTAGSAGGYR
jgi:23S rRNA (cytidine1920-2'-O)/16S rRNA (cytidine1409-2'-O)-methyltransferase